jgi:hypothetical protein
VLGTALGGLTPANDAIIIDQSQVLLQCGISGTVAGVGNDQSSPTTYRISGTNYQVGSGCTMTLDVQADGSIPGVWSFDTQGTNYVVGDLLTVAGTQFPGGTSPANNITMVVT